MAGMPKLLTLYPRNHSVALDPELFKDPPAEYRGTPFWSWNTRLDIEQLFRQIDQFRLMGFGGFHMHSRTGLATEYLGREFMAAVRACTEKAARDSMLAWLYDEDRWPSGFAGGLVTRDKQFRAMHLLWTARPYSGTVAEACQDERAAGTRSENGTLIGRYEVVLEGGYLASYRRLADSEKPSGSHSVWHAYLETNQPSSWFNHQTYVDTLNPAAIRRFIEVTHERYAEAVGEHFGGTVPAIFTDEPQFPKKTTLLRAQGQRDVIIPFTRDFLETFLKTYGQKLEDHLPELFWELPNRRVSVVRYRYHDHTAERFAAAFGDTLGRWCEEHGIALTGHMLGEPTLYGQTRAVGEVMRAMRSFQLPGIDILCDKMEYTTAKQAQSIAHQFGRPGVLSELYGVTNWDFDFAGHKRQGDWQAALGVTVRVPHLAWVSMAGESKRDYPAAIGYQSPWYTQYKLVEDHFARVNAVLTRGAPHVRVGVIHPVESYWLIFGPVDQTHTESEEREAAFRNVTGWLLHGLVDFDYICESLLPEQAAEEGNSAAKGQADTGFRVGEMSYDAVVVPGMRTIRSTTLQRLVRFADAGGTVIFAGEVPSLVDAQPSEVAIRLANRCRRVPLNYRHLMQALAPFRELEVRCGDGSDAATILHQIRRDGDRRHVFLCNTDRSRPCNDAEIRIHGRWRITLLDTMSGETRPLSAQLEDGCTVVPWSFSAHGHLLITLEPEENGSTARRPLTAAGEPERQWIERGRLSDPVPVTLSEPNVLLLDQAEWRLDDGPWQEREEILRLDNKVRQQLGLPFRGGRNAQPWTDVEPAPVLGQLQVRFTIQSDVDIDEPSLALEDPENVQIHLGGRATGRETTGWWVDESIKTMTLPSIAAGTHELVLTIPFTRKTNLENCFLLGDFGVQVSGRHARVIAPVRELAFGDWVHQGLPFYAGNLTYHCTIEADGQDMMIEASRYKAPLLTAQLDGGPTQPIAFAPYQLELGRLVGRHRLDITAYGNRVNTFGALHNANEKLTWFGPAAWRQTGEHWAYEYQLKPMGILIAPSIRISHQHDQE
jgi:hypothetical protein